MFLNHGASQIWSVDLTGIKFPEDPGTPAIAVRAVDGRSEGVQLVVPSAIECLRAWSSGSHDAFCARPSKWPSGLGLLAYELETSHSPQLFLAWALPYRTLDEGLENLNANKDLVAQFCKAAVKFSAVAKVASALHRINSGAARNIADHLTQSKRSELTKQGKPLSVYGGLVTIGCLGYVAFFVWGSKYVPPQFDFLAVLILPVGLFLPIAFITMIVGLVQLVRAKLSMKPASATQAPTAMTESGGKAAVSRSSYVATVAILTVLCLARAAAVAWFWPQSWPGIIVVLVFLHVAFGATTGVLGIAIAALLLPLSRRALQSTHRAALGIAMATVAVAAGVFGLWQCGGAVMPDDFYNSVGVSRTMWAGMGFGVSIANVLVPALCIKGLKSRVVAGRLGPGKAEHDG